MKIALDWDGTFTRDPGLWAWFAKRATCHGHIVRIVTFRDIDDCKDILATLDEHGLKEVLPIECTGGIQKREYCEKVGWMPDVWIDDQPEFIVRSDNYFLGKMLIDTKGATTSEQSPD